MGIQILLVEQDQVEREQLLSSLRDEGHLVRQASGLEQISAAAQTSSLDLLVMDWSRPKCELIDVLVALRTSAQMRSLPVVVLSHYDDVQTKIAALDAGADDYMVKPCDMGELQARIRAVLRRRTPQSNEGTLRVGGLRLDPHTLSVMAETDTGPRPISLSPLEFRLLHFLATHPQHVHTRTQLLDRVWGSQVFVGERTVDVHVRKLRKALAGTLCEGLIQTVRSSGYRLVANVGSFQEIQLIGMQPETATSPAKLLAPNRSPVNRAEPAKKQASLET